MNVTSLIEQLEGLVSSGTGVPATGKVLVDREKLAELVSQIQTALPADLQEAQDFLQMRENLINQALSEARRIRTSSEDEARNRVGESEVLKEARKQSDDIVAAAQQRAQRILDEADVQGHRPASRRRQVRPVHSPEAGGGAVPSPLHHTARHRCDVRNQIEHTPAP